MGMFSGNPEAGAGEELESMKPKPPLHQWRSGAGDGAELGPSYSWARITTQAMLTCHGVEHKCPPGVFFITYKTLLVKEKSNEAYPLIKSSSQAWQHIVSFQTLPQGWQRNFSSESSHEEARVGGEVRRMAVYEQVGERAAQEERSRWGEPKSQPRMNDRKGP